MQAVILAAGKGTRMQPLTQTRPKVLISLGNTTLLEHNINQLKGIANEIIIVTHCFEEMIQSTVQSEHAKIKYVHQEICNGTGGALLSAHPYLQERFLVLNGDDLYAASDLKRLLQFKYGILATSVKDPQKWGILETHQNKVIKIIEKPKQTTSTLANAGAYIFSRSIFDHVLKPSVRGELEITDYVNYICEHESMEYTTVQEYWFPIGYPWHLLTANEYFLSQIQTAQFESSESSIEGNVFVKGNLISGKHTVIKHGTVIEGNVRIGNNCQIGPHAHIRGPVTIGDNCNVGHGSEIKNTIIGAKTKIAGRCFVGDSILGEGVRIGTGTTLTNRRFDQKTVRIMINSELVDTCLDKMGCVIGDYARLGANTSTAPGVTIGCHTWIMGNSFLRGSIPQDSFLKNSQIFTIDPKPRVELKDKDLRGFR